MAVDFAGSCLCSRRRNGPVLFCFLPEIRGQPAAYEAYYEPVDADNVCYEDGYVYVGSHLLVTAAENASFKQIQSLAGDFGGEIVGYISLSNDYQINFPEGRTYDELLEIADTMEADSHVFSAELELVQTLQADTVDYTTDPWGPSSGMIIQDRNGRIFLTAQTGGLRPSECPKYGPKIVLMLK